MEVGEVFASYRLESVIGRGGMGVVYAAHDTAHGRRVALKVLAPELSGDPGFRKRFSDEVRTVTSLTNPHVVPVHTFGVVDDRMYLDMALVDGPSLADVLATGPLGLTQAVDAVEQIAEALAAAHARGLVHRDVKPGNVLMARGRRDHLYLCDFGISHSVRVGAEARSGRLRSGTVAYMPPEQARGGQLDTTADVYALGALLFHCLTGRPPFVGATAEQVLDAHRRATVPPLPVGGSATSLNDRDDFDDADVRTALDFVIAAAMHKDPAQRYQTVGRFADAVRAAAAGVVLGGDDGGGAVASVRGRRERSAEAPGDTAATEWSFLDRGGEAPTGTPVLSPPLRRAPAPVGPLLGRDRVVVELCALLQTERLVTLVGPGGVGKTRLAQEVAARTPTEGAGAEVDDVWFVDLTAVSAADRVPGLLAAAVGLEVTGEDAVSALARWATSQRALLVLDNLEQLLPEVAELVDVLGGGPHLRVLTTSREPLGLRGEVVHTVEPLPVPAPQRSALQGDATPSEVRALADVPSVALFVERARRARTGFRLTGHNARAVAAICTRVDGLPLALELVAGHSRVLSPHALLLRLSWALGTPPATARSSALRQQTLTGTIAWSYDLLSEQGRDVLLQLSVFPGTFSLDAAVDVARSAAVSSTADAVIDVLASLVERNLVQAHLSDEEGDEDRYSLLMTIREFAAQRLEAAGRRTAARTRFAQHYTQAVSLPDGRTKEQSLHVRGVARRELHNLLGALDVVGEADDRDAELVLLQPIVSELLHQWRPTDVLELVSRVLSRPGGRLAARTWCLTAGEVAAFNAGLWEQAAAWLDRAEAELEAASGDVDPSAIIDLRIAQLGFAMTRGDARTALHDVRRLLTDEPARFAHTPLWALEKQLVAVSGAVAAADPGWVVAFLRDQLRTASDPDATSWIINGLAEVLIRWGRAREGLEVLSGFDALTGRTRPPESMRVYHRVLSAQAHLDLGHWADAHRLLDEGERLAGDIQLESQVVECRLRRVRALRAQGELAAAAEALGKIPQPGDGADAIGGHVVVHHLERARLARMAGNPQVASSAHARAWRKAVELGVQSHDEYMETWVEGVAQLLERRPRVAAVLLGCALEYAEDFMPSEEPLPPLTSALEQALGPALAQGLVATGRQLEAPREPDWRDVVARAERVLSEVGAPATWP